MLENWNETLETNQFISYYTFKWKFVFVSINILEWKVFFVCQKDLLTTWSGFYLLACLNIMPLISCLRSFDKQLLLFAWMTCNPSHRRLGTSLFFTFFYGYTTQTPFNNNHLFCQRPQIHLIKSKWFSLLSFASSHSSRVDICQSRSQVSNDKGLS